MHEKQVGFGGQWSLALWFHKTFCQFLETPFLSRHLLSFVVLSRVLRHLSLSRPVPVAKFVQLDQLA